MLDIVRDDDLVHQNHNNEYGIVNWSSFNEKNQNIKRTLKVVDSMAPSTFLTQIQHVLLQKNSVLQENNTNCLVHTIGASKIPKLKQSQLIKISKLVIETNQYRVW